MTAGSRRWRDVLLVAFLFGTWLVPGLIGRHPWKPDEGYSFGVVLSIVESGDHVVPMLAGEPFMEKPPLLYNVAACLGKWLLPVFPLHDGVRAAMLLFNLLTCLFLGLAAREMYGAGKGWLAPLILIACVGPIHDAHMLVTDFTMLTGFALGFYGLALSVRRPWLGGLAAGTGLGVAFMAKGLLGPGLIGLTALLLPACYRNWRTRQYLFTLVGMGLAALPWLLIWPCLLYARDHQLFWVWFWDNNFGRYLGLNRLGPPGRWYFYLKTVPWYDLPAWPLAVWVWWRNRAQLRQQWQLQLCLTGAVLIFVVLSTARTNRDLYSLPLLVPLSLAAVAGLDGLRDRLSVWVNRVSLAVFGSVIGAMWLAWIGFLLRAPAWFWGRVHARVPRYEPQFEWAPFLIALVFTGLFIWRIVAADSRVGRNVIANWAAALACGYLLAMTIGLPLCEANNSYRPLALELQAKLRQEGVENLASSGLQEVARATFHYWIGLKTARAEFVPGAIDRCQYCIVQGNYRINSFMGPPSPAAWDLLWEAKHGGKESFRLYRKKTP